MGDISNLAIVGCTSGKDLAGHIENALARAGDIDIMHVPLVHMAYSDGAINAKVLSTDEADAMKYAQQNSLDLLVEERLKKDLPNTHVVITQRLVDPFSLRPAHYAVLELMRKRIAGEITDEGSARVLMSQRLEGHLKSGVAYSPEHQQGGMIKENKFRELWNALKEFMDINQDVTLSQLEGDRRIHYELQGHFERITRDRTFNDELNELFITAALLKQYGAREITALLPYFEGRSDRDTTHGEGNLSRQWAGFMKESGINRIVTWRRHSDRQVGYYRKRGIEFHEVFYDQNMRQMYIDRLVNKFANQIVDPREIAERLVVVGPDEGSEKETIVFAEELTRALKLHPSLGPDFPSDYSVPWIIYEKNREGKAQVVKDITPWKSSGIDKNANLGSYIVVVRDDIFDTGGTNEKLLKRIGLMSESGERAGTGYCFIVADAPVFSGGGIDRVFSLHERKVLFELYASRSVEPPLWTIGVGRTIGYVDIRTPFTREVEMIHRNMVGR